MSNFTYPTPEEVINGSAGRLVSYFLMCSYLYYICDRSIWSDYDFDKLCEKLLECYDDIDHPHKYLIDKNTLEAGTGFSIRETEYPSMTVHAASQWWFDMHPEDRQATKPKRKRKKVEPEVKQEGWTIDPETGMWSF